MAEICFRSKSDEHGGQIYTSLIVYLILKLGEIPKELAEKPVDKLPYLPACPCQEISFVHWIDKVMKSYSHFR